MTSRRTRPIRPPAPKHAAHRDIEWFWASVPIVAKHHSRRLPWADDETTALWTAFTDIAARLGTPRLASVERPTDLRALLEQMDLLLEAVGLPVRSPLRQEAYDWVAVAEALATREDNPSTR
jgi:hypothetical protein